MDILNKISALYVSQGDKHYGEGITQTQHAVQCARLAVLEGESAEMVVAALLHDIGHLLAEESLEHGNFKHDKIGSDYLADFFPSQVTEPIRLHAQAKRYLCTVEAGYQQGLSAASLHSLKHQGGLMTEEEVRRFEAEPCFTQAIKLRRWDDTGKDTALAAIPFADFKSYLAAARLPE